MGREEKIAEKKPIEERRKDDNRIEIGRRQHNRNEDHRGQKKRDKKRIFLVSDTDMGDAIIEMRSEQKER